MRFLPSSIVPVGCVLAFLLVGAPTVVRAQFTQRIGDRSEPARGPMQTAPTAPAGPVTSVGQETPPQWRSSRVVPAAQAVIPSAIAVPVASPAGAASQIHPPAAPAPQVAHPPAASAPVVVTAAASIAPGGSVTPLVQTAGAQSESESVSGGLTLANIESRKAEALESSSLSAEHRQAITDQYTRAAERISEANQLAVQMESLRAELAGVAQESERLQAAAAGHVDALLPHDASRLHSEDIRASIRSAEAGVAEHRNRLQAVTAEIERRTTRLRELPELQSQAKHKQEENHKQLAAGTAEGELPELAAARRTRLEASVLMRQRELEWLQLEARTYPETARLLSLRRDASDRAMKHSQRHLSHYQRLLAEREKADALEQAAAARRAAVNAHPAVRAAARINTELAEANSQLVAAHDQVRDELQKVESDCEEYSLQYESTRTRANAAQFTQAIGMMLRNQQSQLPDAKQYRERQRKISTEESLLNLRLLEWENERRKIVDQEAVVDQYLQAVSDSLGLIEQVDVRTELNEVIAARLSLYAGLIENGKNHLGSLTQLAAATDKIAGEIEGQASFIAQHILWVRSTAPLSPSLLSPLLTAVAEITSWDKWSGVGEALRNDLKRHPLTALLLLPLLWLLATRSRMRARLADCAQDAYRSSATGMQPTLRAVVLTGLIAAPLPGLIALVSWRLTEVIAVGQFGHALGMAGLIASATYLVIEFIRAACQEKGLGDAHFSWDAESLAALRRSMALAKISFLPASFVCSFAELTDDPLVVNTVGRVALIVQMLSLATIVFELLRPSSSFTQSIRGSDRLPWARNTYRIWATVLVLLPAVLAFVSAIGFHYTATRLSVRLAVTWGVLALIAGGRAFAMRWLQVVYRRFAIRRSREKRAALQARQLAVAESGETPIVSDSTLELRLTEINDQAQSLIRIAATVLGAALLLVIWHEIMPAIGYLNRFTFWENGLRDLNEQGSFPRVTLVDLLFGGACFTVTVLACRNLPGLLDISVFQRLPLDPGARYAASALTQYTLIVVGAVVCFRQIGIGWQSVQWLVAAMSVGLGFGLQEIFANFVSGIILLFERPVRVGDTVTIGNVSGTVTSIRMRATTVLDWDNKELIVPNRDFVTGNLVNWTLSNPNIRLVLQVGIAYGSDTRLATQLLLEAAKQNPLTLSDPEPTVIFNRFGDSRLDFELRVFVAGITNLRMLRHELNMTIDEAFRRHQIEIAIPQQKVHYSVLPDGIRGTIAAPEVRSAEQQMLEEAATHHTTKKQVA